MSIARVAGATVPASFPRLSVGGGFVGAAGLAEATLSPLPWAPHLSLGIDKGAHEGYAYGEVAVNLLFTVGVGAGYQFASREGARYLWHVVAGLPIPIMGLRP